MDDNQWSVLEKIHTLPQSIIPVNHRAESCFSAPIFTVPNEIFQMIFHFYSYLQEPKDLIMLTHVCRAWRSVALDYSEIWTGISLMHPQLMESFLIHSQNRPLNVTLEMNSPRPSDLDPSEVMQMDLTFLTQIGHHSKRIGSLYLEASSQTTVDFLSTIWTELPFLSAIELYPTDNGVEKTELNDIPLPSLQSICIFSIPIALPWRNCQNIVDFSICGICDECITIDDIVAVISASPRIETVRLEDLFYQTSAPSYLPSPQFTVLPALYILNLSRLPTWDLPPLAPD